MTDHKMRSSATAPVCEPHTASPASKYAHSIHPSTTNVGQVGNLQAGWQPASGAKRRLHGIANPLPPQKLNRAPNSPANECGTTTPLVLTNPTGCWNVLVRIFVP